MTEQQAVENRGIPGTMLDPRAMAIRWLLDDVREVEGVTVKRYRAYVDDGILLAMLGHEPAGPRGKLVWHLSVSHRAGVENGPRGTQREIFTRYPSWDEMKSAKYKLLPVDVPMSLEFPVRNPKEGYLNVAQTCLHLWEKLL